jgi:hypothetical protein
MGCCVDSTQIVQRKKYVTHTQQQSAQGVEKLTGSFQWKKCIWRDTLLLFHALPLMNSPSVSKQWGISPERIIIMETFFSPSPHCVLQFIKARLARTYGGQPVVHNEMMKRRHSPS